jgi:hypothetical protein
VGPLLERMMVRVVVRRYRAPVPLMLAVILIGRVLRMVITPRTRAVSARTLPGVMRSHVVLPLIAAPLAWPLTGRE